LGSYLALLHHVEDRLLPLETDAECLGILPVFTHELIQCLQTEDNIRVYSQLAHLARFDRLDCRRRGRGGLFLLLWLDDDLFLRLFLGRLVLLIRIRNDNIIIRQSNVPITITILLRLNLLPLLQSLHHLLLVLHHKLRAGDNILKPLLHIPIMEIRQFRQLELHSLPYLLTTYIEGYSLAYLMELASRALYFYPFNTPLLAKSRHFFFFARTSLYLSLSDVSLSSVSSNILKELRELMSKEAPFFIGFYFWDYSSFIYLSRAFWLGWTGLGLTVDCLLLAIFICSSNLSIDSSIISLNHAPTFPSWKSYIPSSSNL
jgi:hypothetical protein